MIGTVIIVGGSSLGNEITRILLTGSGIGFKHHKIIALMSLIGGSSMAIIFTLIICWEDLK